MIEVLLGGYAAERLFLGGSEGYRNYSEETARKIDAEIASLIADADRKASAILVRERKRVEALVAALIANETLQGEELAAILAPPWRALRREQGPGGDAAAREKPAILARIRDARDRLRFWRRK